MLRTSDSLQFFIGLAKVQSVISRRFDGRLGGGLSFTEFIILLQLAQAEWEKMRRIDLADKIWLTASGVTRILLPMEKIGLISREINERDARVSYVILAPGGKTKLAEAMERAQMLCEEAIPEKRKSDIAEFTETLTEIRTSLALGA